jgi:hypothetical protein
MIIGVESVESLDNLRPGELSGGGPRFVVALTTAGSRGDYVYRLTVVDDDEIEGSCQAKVKRNICDSRAIRVYRIRCGKRWT